MDPTTVDPIDEIKQLHAKARYHKRQARAARDFEDYDEARDELLDAIGLLEKAERLSINLPANDSESESLKTEGIRELADCHGMAGGNYRRLAQLAESKKMYDRGFEYEVRSDVEDSYNRVNRIVVRLLENPNCFADLKDDIDDAGKVIHDQVYEGSRGQQWWAWADLGLIRVLQQDLNAASDAYGHFEGAGARSSDYKSVLEVIDELKSRFGEEHTHSDLLSKISKKLNEMMP